jgi:transglutaminase-like putative cysteine protease
MTLTSLQQVLVETNKGAFPLHFFILLAICISLLPMKETPIDWTPVKTMMGKLSEASENAVYYLSNSSKSYTTGYSSLNVTGGKIKKSKKTQLSLKTAEAPYYVFTDENTGKQMKMTKVLYLHGENEVDKEQFVSFLQFLYDNDVDASTADIFSQISKVSVEYVYLNTEDEIVPAGTIVIKGNTEGAHKKGYKLDVVYLDIDYGSPYLINLLESSQISSKKMTYEEASRYMKKVYRMDFDAIISEEEYDSLVKDMSIEDALDATGVTTQMQKLAKEITADASTEYDKCKLIETYLRQYRYNVDAVGGYKEDSTMATAEGMADIADRFLFDTKEGYCVHFTSSMVMLLRAAGIPARVETGYRYVYPMEKQEDYIVQASAAHVWPEAYIDGAGWVPFEPTSGYFNADDVTWHRKGDEEAALEKYKALETKVAPQLNYASADKEQVDRFFAVIVGLAVVLTIVIIIILAVITTIIVRRLKYKYASYEERLKIDVDNIKQIIAKHANGTIDDRGFLSDYLKLAPDEIYEEVEGAFELYYNLLYGGDSRVAVSEAQSLNVKEISEKLKNIYK